MSFWQNIWQRIKNTNKAVSTAPNTAPVTDVQKWNNVSEFNPLAIVNAKLSSIACDEATIDILSNYEYTKPLKQLAQQLQNKCYDICNIMNGVGGCFVTMATDMNGLPYHRILQPNDVSVYSIECDKITECALIIDREIIDHVEYRLIRHHHLDSDGTLYIYYYTANKQGDYIYWDKWEHAKDSGVMYLNANTVGVAYIKSPQDSRGLSPIFGVPLNFGCHEVEEQIKQDRQALADEMKKMSAKLFVDKSISRLEKSPSGMQVNGLPEDVFLIQKRAGVDGSLIDEFAPQTRFNDYLKKLSQSYADYENQIGLNHGFLTEAEYTSRATATEIKIANIKTISFVKKIQTALEVGFEDVMRIDSILLNIPLDSWELHCDWSEPFENSDEQYERISHAVDRGILEPQIELQWLMPNLTADERNAMLERIKQSKQTENTVTVQTAE